MVKSVSSRWDLVSSGWEPSSVPPQVHSPKKVISFQSSAKSLLEEIVILIQSRVLERDKVKSRYEVKKESHVNVCVGRSEMEGLTFLALTTRTRLALHFILNLMAMAGALSSFALLCTRLSTFDSITKSFEIIIPLGCM